MTAPRGSSELRITRTPAPEDDWASVNGALLGIPDYDNPPCKGQAPLFDWPTYVTPAGDSVEVSINRLRVSDWFLPALFLCGSCPDDIQARCLRDTVRAEDHFSGVAGGRIFHLGKEVPQTWQKPTEATA